jgi:hypothetical protein
MLPLFDGVGGAEVFSFTEDSRESAGDTESGVVTSLCDGDDTSLGSFDAGLVAATLRAWASGSLELRLCRFSLCLLSLSLRDRCSLDSPAPLSPLSPFSLEGSRFTRRRVLGEVKASLAPSATTL